MTAIRILAICSVIVGIIGVSYGGVSYTQKDTVAKLGPVEVQAEQEKRLNIPLWAGIAAIVIGGGVLVGTARKS